VVDILVGVSIMFGFYRGAMGVLWVIFKKLRYIAMSELDRMKKEWLELGIEKYFPRVHHFSRIGNSDPPSLHKHYEATHGKNIGLQNRITLERALAVIRILKDKKEGWQTNPHSKYGDIRDAINEAWKECPGIPK